MSRGHEVKSVQEAWMAAEAEKELRKKPRKTEEQIDYEKKREPLELSRTRIARELAETKSDTRRGQLRAALAHLDAEIEKLSVSS